MKVRVTQGGGFAGLVSDLGTLDTDDLPPEAADEVRAAVAELEGAAPGEVGADIPGYQVHVLDERGERTLTVAAGEPDQGRGPAAPGLGVLLEHLGA